mgnify:CR=1 FL=1
MLKGEQGYLETLKELVDKAESKGFRDVRDGHKRCSLFGRQLRFNLEESFPLMTHKKVFVRGAFEELMWMLRGETDNQILKDKNVHIWDLWEGQIDPDNPTELGKIYGDLWRNFGYVAGEYVLTDRNGRDIYEDCLEGFDQIEWVKNEIKTNPSSSRMLVSGWNPQVSTTTPKEAVLPCCHVLYQFFVEDGKLSCQLYQRSGDFIIGNPINIVFYSLLTHLMAQQCDLDVGEFIIAFGDVHLYSDQLEMAKEILTRPIYDFPQIKINKAKDLYSYEWSDIEILNYVSGDKISIPVAK